MRWNRKEIEEYYHLSCKALGTDNEIQIWGKNAKRTTFALYSLLQELEMKFSYYLDTSEISTINRFAGKGEVEVSMEVLDVIKEAKRIHTLTSVFDITTRPIGNVWETAKTMVQDLQVKDLQLLVDMDGVVIRKPNKIMLLKEHQEIDLGGIAKGYCADKMMEEARKAGCSKGIINLGGDVTIYNKQDSTVKVGIQNPYSKEKEAVLSLQIERGAIATSGIYERYNEKLGLSAHHILSNRIMKPAQNKILSVSVLSSKAVYADALATSFLVLGIEESKKLLTKLTDVEVLFITMDNKVYASGSLNKKIHKSNLPISYLEE